MDMMRVPGRAPASRSPLTDEVREVLVTLMGQFGHFTGFVIRILIHFLPTFSNFFAIFYEYFYLYFFSTIKKTNWKTGVPCD